MVVSVAKGLARKFGLFERFSKELTHENLSDLLPYRAWDPETGIYLLDYGPESRVGWFFTSYTVVPPKEAFVKEYESLLGAMPPKSTVQIALVMVPYLNKLFSEFLKFRIQTRLGKKRSSLPNETRKLLLWMLTEKIRLLRSQCFGEKADSSYPLLAKQHCLYFSFTVSPKGLPPERGRF